MATRTFADADGTHWLVWRVTPGQHTAREKRGATLPEELEGGWLCFESDAEKRRMYPVPPAWESLSDEHLALLCRAGVAVQARPAREPLDDALERPAG
jgi:hypothetical protein